MPKGQAQEGLRKAVRLVIESGYHLDEEALNFLRTTEDPVRMVSKALSKIRLLPGERLVLSADILRNSMEAGVVKGVGVEVAPTEVLVKPKVPVPKKMAKKVQATEIEEDIRILKDASENMRMADFPTYFRDRFERLREIIQMRSDARGVLPLNEAVRSPERELRMVGMVRDRRSKEGKVFLDFEDLQSSVVVMAPAQLASDAERILLDGVLCVVARPWRKIFIAQEFVLPDIPETEIERADVPVSVVLLSDFHIGSKMFEEEAFSRFIRWIRGDYGSPRVREIAQSVKYVIVNGDVVDGVGVYPGQREELVCEEIRDQYEMAATFVQQIPEHIGVIVSPGNHDATNKALPHRPISKEHAEALYESREFITLGNPALISLHGVKILVYHGEGLDDILATVPGLGYNTVGEAMRLLLRYRHLAPIYGKETGILPLERDPLVIDQKPDVFHTAHVHVFCQENYRRTIMLNAGGWQAQTSYQRRRGLQPTIGLVPVLNLQSMEVASIDFSKKL